MTKETLVFLHELVRGQNISAGNPNGVQIMLMAQAALGELENEIKALEGDVR